MINGAAAGIDNAWRAVWDRNRADRPALRLVSIVCLLAGLEKFYAHTVALPPNKTAWSEGASAIERQVKPVRNVRDWRPQDASAGNGQITHHTVDARRIFENNVRARHNICALDSSPFQHDHLRSEHQTNRKS